VTGYSDDLLLLAYFGNPKFVAVDNLGYLFVSDNYVLDSTRGWAIGSIRKVSVDTGFVTTIAGGSGLLYLHYGTLLILLF
jgi:hypothetical protein